MNSDDLHGIRYALTNKYGFVVVTQSQVVVTSTIMKHPGIKGSRLVTKLDESGIPRSTIYRVYKQLKDYNVVDEAGHITFNGADMKPKSATIDDKPYYPLVGFVRDRIMPENANEYEWVHIATYIASQYNSTELCNALKTVVNPVDEIHLLKQMQNGLAFCSIMAGDVSNWNDMKGNAILLPSMVELFKKAGVKVK